MASRKARTSGREHSSPNRLEGTFGGYNSVAGDLVACWRKRWRRIGYQQHRILSDVPCFWR